MCSEENFLISNNGNHSGHEFKQKPIYWIILMDCKGDQRPFGYVLNFGWIIPVMHAFWKATSSLQCDECCLFSGSFNMRLDLAICLSSPMLYLYFKMIINTPLFPCPVLSIQVISFIAWDNLTCNKANRAKTYMLGKPNFPFYHWKYMHSFF